MKSFSVEQLANSGSAVFATKNTICSYHEHTHAYYEMTLYHPFNGNIYINGKKISVDTICAVLHSPSNFHRTEVFSDDDASFIKVTFDGSFLPDTSIPHHTLYFTELNPTDLIYGLFEEILAHKDDQNYATALVTAAVSYFIKFGYASSLKELSGGYKQAIAAMEIVNRDMQNEISLPSVAGQLGITPQYLSKVFTKHIGTNFSSYLTNIRLFYAENLILNTDKSITQICYECGFNDFSHFLRCFKTNYGMSPRQYKKRKIK